MAYNKGGKREDPLRVERNVTIVAGKGPYATLRFVCQIQGEGRNERVSVLGVVKENAGDMNSASRAARVMTEKGHPTFVAVAADNKVFLAQPVESIQGITTSAVAAFIAGERRDARANEFRAHH